MAESLINKEINDFYSQTSEQDRLKYGLGPLEFERNKELISRFLPEKPAIIIDVGGGPGIYSEWLSNLGFEVHLVDPVQKHIVQAKKRLVRLQNKFKVHLGDASALNFPDEFADILICHGPLYHLQEKAQRLKALAESRRILKPSGVFLGFAINYISSAIVGLLQGVLHNPDLLNMCLQEITTGLHEAPASMPGVMPKAYYHRPDELISEISEAGYTSINLFAVEGIVWLEKNYFDSMGNPGRKSNLLNLLKLTESDRNLMAFSPHMMVSALKKIPVSG